jgi:hypothetical protein
VASRAQTPEASRKRSIRAAEAGHRARKLRREAADLDARASTLTHTIAAIEGERIRLLIHAERLRWQADEGAP